MSLNKPIGSKYFLTQLEAGIFGIEPNGSLFQRVSFVLSPPGSMETTDSSKSLSWPIRLTRAESKQQKFKTEKPNEKENANYI